MIFRNLTKKNFFYIISVATVFIIILSFYFYSKNKQADNASLNDIKNGVSNIENVIDEILSPKKVFSKSELPFVFEYSGDWSVEYLNNSNLENKNYSMVLTSSDEIFEVRIAYFKNLKDQKIESISGGDAEISTNYFVSSSFEEINVFNNKKLLFSKQGGVKYSIKNNSVFLEEDLPSSSGASVYEKYGEQASDYLDILDLQSKSPNKNEFIKISYNFKKGQNYSLIWGNYKNELEKILLSISKK